MNLSVLAASGYGKSYITQAIAERNTERYDHVVLLDYKDEYRGLCSKDHGPAPFKNWMAGPVELQVGPGKWAEMKLDGRPGRVAGRAGEVGGDGRTERPRRDSAASVADR